MLQRTFHHKLGLFTYIADEERDVILPLYNIKTETFIDWCDNILSYRPEIFIIKDTEIEANPSERALFRGIRTNNKKDAMLVKLVWG